MSNKHDYICSGYPHFLHGADYNPDQWLHSPQIIDEDFQLMKLANCNAMAVGIFGWTTYEPEEGRFEFGWMDDILDRMHAIGSKAILATPTGAMPAWMAKKYPEIRRVDENGIRAGYQQRHNHCFSSPVYREKAAIIIGKLAERYKDHPALGVWHLSNEYNGTCYSDLAMADFQNWLKDKYNNSLDELNHAWWSRFWSHEITDWAQVNTIDPSVDGMTLDWHRFTNDMTIDFMKHEIASIREHDTATPVTTNFMGCFPGLNYDAFAEHIDVISDDWYPEHHHREHDWRGHTFSSFRHDIMRSMKKKPFMLMESTPSSTNWMTIPKLKRPGQHNMQSLLAVAHGADTVQYFQWRKGRGGSEKFHGAVVDHAGGEHTRVFKDVSELGENLKKLEEVLGTMPKPEVAVIHDWENRWALELSQGPRRVGKNYIETCTDHYYPFWQMGIPTDVISEDHSFEGYKLIVAPMLFMLKPGVADRLKDFVKNGGKLISTYLSGIVNDTNLCFMGGWPGDGLGEVFGLWAEEIDAIYDEDKQSITWKEGNELGLTGSHDAKQYCDLIHAQSAKVLATYDLDFYAGNAAITVNDFGEGQAYYIATRLNDDAHLAMYKKIAEELNLKASISRDLPEGIGSTLRSDGEHDYVFVYNTKIQAQTITLDQTYENLLKGDQISGDVELQPYDHLVLKRKTQP